MPQGVDGFLRGEVYKIAGPVGTSHRASQLLAVACGELVGPRQQLGWNDGAVWSFLPRAQRPLGCRACQPPVAVHEDALVAAAVSAAATARATVEATAAMACAVTLVLLQP